MAPLEVTDRFKISMKTSHAVSWMSDYKSPTKSTRFKPDQFVSVMTVKYALKYTWLREESTF